MNERPAAVAGMFYPSSARQIEEFMASCRQMKIASLDLNSSAPRVLVMPHAGYIYSGCAAYQGIRLWDGHQDEIKTVVIIGPAHRVYFEGVAAVSVEAMATPLGDCEIDRELQSELLEQFDFISLSDYAHAEEHSLEVEVPFVQQVVPSAKILPLLNGKISAEEVAQVIAYLWQKQGVYFLISSDLSHFHSYEQASEIDGETADMIDAGQWQALNGTRACGYLGIQGVLKYISDAMPKKSIDIQRIALLNSGDTAGYKNRVVGYGTWAIYATEEERA